MGAIVRPFLGNMPAKAFEMGNCLGSVHTDLLKRERRLMTLAISKPILARKNGIKIGNLSLLFSHACPEKKPNKPNKPKIRAAEKKENKWASFSCMGLI